MKMGTKLFRSVSAFCLVVFLLFPGTVFADADDLAKEADKIIRNAERKMFSGKNEEAAAMLQEAAGLLEQGKAEDPANKKILQTEKKFDRIQTNVDKKLGKSVEKASGAGAALPEKPQPKALSTGSAAATPAAKQTAAAKLPGGVKKRLKDISAHLDNAERYADSDAQKAQYKLGQAVELFDEIDRMYGGQFDPAHPEYADVKDRYNALIGKAAAQGAAEAKAESDAAGAKDAQEKQSAEWLAKFRGYLAYSGQEGHNPDTVVFVPGTSEPEKFADAKSRYEKFKTFYGEYRKTDFPHGKTWELENLADNEAPSRLRQFEEGFASRMGSVVETAENEIQKAMAQLEKDNGWRSDKSIRPNLVDHKWMTSIGEARAKVVAALGADDPQTRQVQKRYDALVAKDKENRQIRKERTFMTPDRYKGEAIDSLKEKAQALVKNDAKEGGAPLRCTIISENWQEETVEEWTDTSRTARRWRTTRRVTSQVAAKTSDGVRLITVALAQDKQSDGNWGPLYGNLHQYSDPMLESNVHKTGP